MKMMNTFKKRSVLPGGMRLNHLRNFELKLLRIYFVTRPDCHGTSRGTIDAQSDRRSDVWKMSRSEPRSRYVPFPTTISCIFYLSFLQFAVAHRQSSRKHPTSHHDDDNLRHYATYCQFVSTSMGTSSFFSSSTTSHQFQSIGFPPLPIQANDSIHVTRGDGRKGCSTRFRRRTRTNVNRMGSAPGGWCLCYVVRSNIGDSPQSAHFCWPFALINLSNHLACLGKM